MNNRFLTFAVIPLCILVIAGCSQKKSRQSSQSRRFPEVSVPQMGSDKDKMDYSAIHFWDAFLDSSKTFRCDSSLVNGVKKQEIETAFGQYATLLGIVDPFTSAASSGRLFDMASGFERRDTASNVFETITALVDKYFYDPNSPVRNEEAYLPFALKLSKCPYLTEAMRQAYGYSARMCALNRIGAPAADFSFTELSGRMKTLYGIKADLTLLFFSNPGCPACKEIAEALKRDARINDLIGKRRLAIVNVYIDLEIAKWKAFAAGYPKSWHSGYDQKYVIRTDVLYNVRAIPSLYLLDKDKKVIMKDATQENVLAYIDNLPD